jgi:hypothetical protein
LLKQYLLAQAVDNPGLLRRYHIRLVGNARSSSPESEFLPRPRRYGRISIPLQASNLVLRPMAQCFGFGLHIGNDAMQFYGKKYAEDARSCGRSGAAALQRKPSSPLQR